MGDSFPNCACPKKGNADINKMNKQLLLITIGFSVMDIFFSSLLNNTYTILLESAKKVYSPSQGLFFPNAYRPIPCTLSLARYASNTLPVSKRVHKLLQ